jgi:hypothetical protein
MDAVRKTGAPAARTALWVRGLRDVVSVTSGGNIGSGDWRSATFGQTTDRGGGTGNIVALIRGLLVVGATAGTLQFRWRRRSRRRVTRSSTPTSFLRMTKIA